MFNQKEILTVLLTSIFLGVIISLTDLQNLILPSILGIFLVIFINSVFKKITSYYLDTEIEIKPWEILRYGYKPNQHFKKPMQIGLFIPIILKVISTGIINWTAALVFDVKGKIYKAAKRHGLYSFSEVTEYEMAYIAAAGIFANIIFAIAGYLTGYLYFAQLNIMFAFFNMIPISNLDGNKIFFGRLTLWAFLAIVVLIGVLAMFVVI
ncbi:hypothetical protein HOD29_05435 [archaeon]|jgi:hypothetical protein|nr:hypothetical protein [archaeon]